MLTDDNIVSTYFVSVGQLNKILKSMLVYSKFFYR